MKTNFRKKNHEYTAIIFSSAFLFITPKVAISSENLLHLPLEELLKIRVTSSTLINESLKTVPASITIFTRAQIQQLGINNLERLLNHVSGYQSYRSDAGFANYSSRSRRLSNSTCEVLVLMDGQRLDHDMFCGMSPTDGDFSLHNVERVEFLRGPGSSIYGDNALLGVINIITAKYQKNILISGGNSQQASAAINLSHHFKNGLQTSLFAHSEKIESGQAKLYDPLIQDFTDEHQQNDNLQSIYWRASWGDWSLQLRHVDKLIEDGYSIGNVSDDGSTLDSYSNLAALNYTHAFNQRWKFDSRIYTNPYKVSFRGRAGLPPIISTLNFAGTDSGMRNHFTWQESESNAILGIDFSRFAITGAELKSATATQTLTSAETLAHDDRHAKAIYGQWQTALSQHLNYIIGIRHDHYSDVTGHASPRFGVIYQANDRNTIKALYGEAFRVPSRIELYLKNNPVQTGNPKLKPEIAKTSELIWMYTHQDHYLCISLFDTRIKNPVILSNTPEPRPYINSSPQHMSGIEAESKWRLNGHWQLDSTITYLFNSPMAINPDAEELIRTSLIYTSQKITFSFSGYYHGKSRDADSSPLGYHSLGGFTTFDAHTQYQLTHEWKLYATLRNLTDKQYNQPAFQNSLNFYGVPGTGREIEVGVRRSF